MDRKKCTKAAVTIGISTMLFFSNTAMAAPLLKIGSRGSEVESVQRRLNDLKLYNYDKITGYYGNITYNGVKQFQRQRGLAVDGIVGQKTYSALGITYGSTSNRGTDRTSSTSSGSTSSSSTLIRVGSRGTKVTEIQNILKSKGYYTYNVDGIFGSRTKNAVKKFQSASSGLAADGIVGPKTMAKLNDLSTPPKKETTQTPSRGDDSSRDNVVTGSVELISWSKVDGIFPRKTNARVVDVDTGKSFNIYRYGGTNHADVEPRTAADTAIMKQIYGGSWSWNRRAIIVEVAGRRIAASMNGMPHGGQDILGNNFNGQFCIHFLGSKTHGTNRVDAAHQSMVYKAAQSK